jgi:hypothetical protein
MPGLDTEHTAARRIAFGQAMAPLQQIFSAAVSMLGKVLVNQSSPPTTRPARQNAF